jgi:hypothetical protein
MDNLVESRCGILCGLCHYREEVGCNGCVNIEKPFWGESCPVKDCCEGRGHEHCGECPEFPCELLNGFAYDKEQGDNGKRILTCRAWACGFDADGFISAVTRQDIVMLRAFFLPEAVICWHDSNEQFTVDEYIRANCGYPGNWNGEIQRVEKTTDGLLILTKIFSDDVVTFVTAFVKLQDGKISRLDECYADYSEEIPQWRRKMGIGKPISR